MQSRLLIYVIFYLILISGCTRPEEEQSIGFIQGSWGVDMEYESLKIKSSFRSRDGVYPIRRSVDLGLIRGFKFYGDTCNYRAGFFNYLDKENGMPLYKGTNTTYKIIADTLKIWNIVDSSWSSLIIKKLNYDTLTLEGLGNDEIWRYLKIKKSYKSISDFDAISIFSVSSSGEYLDDLHYIDRKGNYLYQRVESLGASPKNYCKLNNDDTDLLFSNFKYVDLNSLRKTYISTRTGGKTSYCIFFIRKGQIVKTIIDNDMVSPDEFQWGYLPILYLRRNIRMVSLKSEKECSSCHDFNDLKLKILKEIKVVQKDNLLESE